MSRDDQISMGLGVAIAGTIAFVAISMCGCGASPLRAHATAATLTMATLATAGDAIREGTQLAVDRCPPRGDDTRAACIDGVESVARAAGAARDTMIPAAHAYRDAVLAAAHAVEDVVIPVLAAAAAAVARQWGALRDALRVLGVDLPPIAFPGGA
jgi:hypothetical protein